MTCCISTRAARARAVSTAAAVAAEIRESIAYSGLKVASSHPQLTAEVYGTPPSPLLIFLSSCRRCGYPAGANNDQPRIRRYWIYVLHNCDVLEVFYCNLLPPFPLLFCCQFPSDSREKVLECDQQLEGRKNIIGIKK